MTNALAVRALSALGDPSRRAIFQRLAAAPASVGQISAGLPVTRSAVSQHLRVLKEAGLVTETPEGTRRIYRLDPAASPRCGTARAPAASDGAAVTAIEAAVPISRSRRETPNSLGLRMSCFILSLR